MPKHYGVDKMVMRGKHQRVTTSEPLQITLHVGAEKLYTGQEDSMCSENSRQKAKPTSTTVPHHGDCTGNMAGDEKKNRTVEKTER